MSLTSKDIQQIVQALKPEFNRIHEEIDELRTDTRNMFIKQREFIAESFKGLIINLCTSS